MAKVLPSINCHFKDNEAVAGRIRQIEDIFAKAGTPAGEQLVHFDVADGMFTFHKSWDEPERLAEMKPAFPFEAHLMVEDPLPAAQRWLAAGARRLVVHMESVSKELFAELAAMAKAAGAEVILGLNPETPAAEALPYFNSASSFLILSVHPGLSGQKFLSAVLEKVSFLRREVPNAKIEIDGGITPETARAAIAAGADALVSDADIFGSADPVAAYRELASL